LTQIAEIDGTAGNAAASMVPLAQIAPDAVEALLDRAFGPDRHGRTAYRLRAGTDAIPALSFAALDASGALTGTIQCWPVLIGETPLAMVGPVAVEPTVQRGGVGRALMARMLDAWEAGDWPPLMMIGDPEYYGRFFAFSADATAGWNIDGPFERRRLLARAKPGQTLPGTGDVLPRP
jgi:predicted N-acetyltransferase YhbS